MTVDDTRNEHARRVAIVTGAAGGIGTAIVARLIAGGFVVAGIDIDGAGLERLKMRVQGADSLKTFEFDATSDVTRGIERVVATLGAPYALVNNAGVIYSGDAVATSDDEWARVIDHNLTGPFRMCRAVLPYMLARGSGVIVNLASIAGVIGLKKRAAYCAAKAGILGLTRALAADHSASGIRINAVNPGTTESPMTRSIIDGADDPAAMRAFMAARQPVGRMGQPDEIAAAVAFLVSDDARYMSGSTITVDGGLSIV